jgi:hypothetical protein
MQILIQIYTAHVCRSLSLVIIAVYLYVCLCGGGVLGLLSLCGSSRIAWQDSDRPCHGPDALVCGQ